MLSLSHSVFLSLFSDVQRVQYEKAGKRKVFPWSRGPATEFIAFADGFHGRTMGALALTWKEGYRTPFQPVMPGVHFAPYGDLDAVRKLAKRGRTAAIFAEPVQGEGGCRPAQADFLRGLRALCDELGILLVFDEVQCGLGRTGHLWAHQAVGVTPDIMTLAKPLAAGLPIGTKTHTCAHRMRLVLTRRMTLTPRALARVRTSRRAAVHAGCG